MESSAEAKIYKFDELYTSLVMITLVQRKSPDSSFELRGVKFMSLFIIIAILSLITILVSVVNLYGSEKLSTVCGNGAVASVLLIIILRAITLLMNRGVLKRLLTNIEKIFPVSAKDQIEYNLPKHVDPIIFRNKVMGLLLSYAFLAYVLLPILKSSFYYLFRGQKYSFTYPFFDSFPIDDNQFGWYALIYCLQIGGSAVALLVYLYEDLVFLTLVTQLCMHYKFLCQSLRQLDAKRELESYQKLCRLICFQNTLTLLRDDINTIFSLSTFFGFIVVKISICMFMFSLMDATSIDLLNLSQYGASVFSLIIQVYQRCSLGTNLYVDSTDLLNSYYDSNWLEGSPKYRKFFVTLMIKANIPIDLQASPLNRIDIEYFKELSIQTYEFLMFLINFTK